MQYSKPMIDLILELRRRVPSNLKPGIKLANPEVLDELIDHYAKTQDNVTRALIKELMQMAGSDWLQRLETNSDTTHTRPRVKVYRGQTSLEQTLTPQQDKPSKKTGRIYRGQVVHS